MAGAEAGDRRREDVLAGRGDGGEAQPGPGTRADGGDRGFVERPLDAPGVLGEHHPGRREAQTAPLPGDQLNAELALQRRDHRRHRRLGDVEPLGRDLDRAAARQLEEGGQLAQSHKSRLMDTQHKFN
jgi:hypothetical protein